MRSLVQKPTVANGIRTRVDCALCTLHDVHMSRVAKRKTKPRLSVVHAERVGAAEFRGNLAKYLKQASAGRPVIIQERGRSAYVLVKLEDESPPSIFGCMSERTEYVVGTVVNAAERWSPGAMP